MEKLIYGSTEELFTLLHKLPKLKDLEKFVHHSFKNSRPYTDNEFHIILVNNQIRQFNGAKAPYSKRYSSGNVVYKSYHLDIRTFLGKKLPHNGELRVQTINDYVVSVMVEFRLYTETENKSLSGGPFSRSIIIRTETAEEYNADSASMSLTKSDWKEHIEKRFLLGLQELFQRSENLTKGYEELLNNSIKRTNRLKKMYGKDYEIIKNQQF
jgi:hypothetical protein